MGSKGYHWRPGCLYRVGVNTMGGDKLLGECLGVELNAFLVGGKPVGDTLSDDGSLGLPAFRSYVMGVRNGLNISSSALGRS